MNHPVAWRIHIYQMSDTGIQESVADLLARVNTLTVECIGAPDRYLIVGCCNLNQARWVHRLVISSDSSATLIHQTARIAAGEAAS